MRKILLLLILCGSGLALKAQNANSIHGIVVDTSLNVKLMNTSVIVLNPKDSTLVDFTQAKADGSFRINNLITGSFILVLIRSGYADYVQRFTLDNANPVKDFGRISLVQKARLLQEVIISGATAIKLKGDTTEFNAGSYKIQPNDRVEDLLRQLPGIEVDQNGKITARGKPVNKVLVDGEEFFGDDPTLVTKNIRADMVDKVQLFEKKSDQAAFTGIDDGKRTTTLNVTLKADKKNGYFGKADGGQSTDRYYQGQGMYNLFRTKQKLSAYLTVGNTNRTGLSIQDNDKFGTTGNVFSSNQGDVLDSFTGRYTGEGLPAVKTGGVHYDAKWNEDKQSINLNYRIGSISVAGSRNTLSQNNLPSGVIISNSDQHNDNTFRRQKLETTYQLTLTPSSILKVTTEGTLSNSQTNTMYVASSTNDNNMLLNNQSRRIDNNADPKNVNITVLLTKKFKKVGRTASLSVSQGYNENNAKGHLYSMSNFYKSTGAIDSTKLFDQYKTFSGTNYAFNSNLTYTHPFSKAFSVGLNYGINFNRGTSDSKSFNQSVPGKYDMLDNVFSNNFKRELTSNQGGADFAYVKNKVNLRVGIKTGAFSDHLTNLSTGLDYHREYVNWSPSIIYRYQFSQQKNLYFYYGRSTIQPAIDQLQPVKVNTDPLNITVGNPDLKPYNSSSYILIVNSTGLSGQGYALDFEYFLRGNPIISNISTDAAGKNTYQFVNLIGKSSRIGYFRISTSAKLKRYDMLVQFNLGMNTATDYNLSASLLNKTQTQDYTASLVLSKSVVKKYMFNVSYTPGYRFSESSLQKQINNNGWISNAAGSFTWYLPGKMQFSSSVNYLFQGKTETFNESYNRVLLSTSITKRFLQKENLSLSLTGNDLLNQNTGFTRITSGANMFTQNQYTTIRRYVMLSLIWDFVKPAPAK